MRALLLFTIAGFFCLETFAVQPQVPSLTASLRSGTRLIDITYDLGDMDSTLLDVTVQVYTNDAANSYYAVNAPTMVGDLGSALTRGENKSILWDIGKDLPGMTSSQLWVKVTAYDLTMRQVPTNDMVLVPAGWFNMGDNYAAEAVQGIDGVTAGDNVPVHAVYGSDFYMGRCEIPNEELVRVFQWAYDAGKVQVITGYDWFVKNVDGEVQILLMLNRYGIGFSSGRFAVTVGREAFPCHPTWYGAQAYCNFRSEMEGLEPCIDFTDWSCDFGKNGYRLPTEAEWEKAARGGLDGQHFPWPSYGGGWATHIDGSKANFFLSGDPYGDEYWGGGDIPIETTPVGYYEGNQFPPGCDMANGFGLCDMAGNVWEWCYDWWTSTYYSESPSLDPTGPLAGEVGNWIVQPCRVVRGGGWPQGGVYSSELLSCSARARERPDTSVEDQGFRIARRDPNANITMGYRTLRSEASSIYGPITVDTIGKDNPGVIQFNTSAIAVDENAGMATLTVMRMGGTQGTASVDYVTANGTAVGGTDFTIASGTLSWADGDNTNQTITVNLTSDSTSEGDETFTVVLSNPVGATIGTYTNVTVTIKDSGSQTPVYRLYSYGLPDSTYEHVWTTDWDEMATMSTVYGWYYEGVAWYAFSDYVQGSTPLYRVYAPSIRQHHYTTDGTEYYVLTEQSGGAWNGEGIQYYVYPDNSVTGTTPVYRFYHAGMGLHHFTISADEAAAIQATPAWGYVYEDIAFYVYP